MLRPLLASLFLSYGLYAQPVGLIISKDSASIQLTAEGASYLASLPLKCINQEYPNKLNHIAVNDSDQAMTPRQMHPCFYGCFDWHSSVHGHWMLVKLLKEFPALPEAKKIRAALSESFTPPHLAAEIKYFSPKLSASFERTYGWAWLLKLQEELLSGADDDFVKWRTALQPLCDTIVKKWMAFLPKQTYPNRTGVHPNTAFGLTMAWDYCKRTRNTAFETLIRQTAERNFLKDKNAPSIWEPDGADFFSPSLEEVDLMRRILPKPDFLKWFNAYMTAESLQHLTQLPVVSDKEDYQIIHLVGLCCSRSWCMKNIAACLNANDKRRKLLLQSAAQHLTKAFPDILSKDNYGGEHWLASFAVYALFQ